MIESDYSLQMHILDFNPEVYFSQNFLDLIGVSNY
jgi:hypothetical protein